MILIKVVAELSEAGKIVPLGPCLDDALVLDAIDGQVACEEYPARCGIRTHWAELRAAGVRHVAVLSGDHAPAADAAGRASGADTVAAGLLPDEKVGLVRDLTARIGPVAMIGDGVNDAPALAAAHVGIAMGAAGTDAALETADVALMADELLKIPYALRLSRATARNIRANIAFSIGLKTAFMIMAVFGLATLWMAVVADMGASLIVIANALRLLRE